MWILVLEAMVALGMLVLIVWLTMGSSRRREQDTAERQTRDSSADSRDQ